MDGPLLHLMDTMQRRFHRDALRTLKSSSTTTSESRSGCGIATNLGCTGIERHADASWTVILYGPGG